VIRVDTEDSLMIVCYKKEVIKFTPFLFYYIIFVMDKIVKVKSRNEYGVLVIPSIPWGKLGHRSLNKVIFEDGTVLMARDDDLEDVKMEEN